jgi:outer membrane lipoprotein-sorting protein
VNGHPCFVISSSGGTAQEGGTQSLWVDEKTFLLRRLVTDYTTAGWTGTVGGKTLTIAAGKSHLDHRFTNERLNKAIPDSAFTVPFAQ